MSATDAEVKAADTAGTVAFNVGRPNVWHQDPTMRDLIPADQQHGARALRLIEVFETRWQWNADCERTRAARSQQP